MKKYQTLEQLMTASNFVFTNFYGPIRNPILVYQKDNIQIEVQGSINSKIKWKYNKKEGISLDNLAEFLKEQE